MDKIQFSVGIYQEGGAELTAQVKIQPGVDSGSLLITGTPGSGKSVCGQMILCQLAMQDIPVIVIDLRSTLVKERIYSAFQEFFKLKIKHWDLYTSHLPCSLLTPTVFADGTVEKSYDSAAAIAKILADHFRFGQTQRGLIAEACEQVIQNGSYHKQGFAALEEALKNLSTRETRSIITRLRTLFLHNPFIDGEWQYASNYIHVMDLTKYASNPPVQSAIAELILFHVWNQVSTSRKRTPIYVYCDEFQNIGLHKSGILEKILTEGRKFGINIVLITQSLTICFSAEEQQLLSQAPYMLIFRSTGRDAERWARQICIPESYTEMTQLLKNLMRGECVIFGSIYLAEENSIFSEPLKIAIQAEKALLRNCKRSGKPKIEIIG